MGDAWTARSGWLVMLACGSLALACGRTAKDGSGSARNVDVEGSAGATGAAGAAGAASSLESAQPNCAISLDGHEGRHCAAYQDGSVWCWGQGSSYGPKNFKPSLEPVQVEGLRHVERVVLGRGHSCAIDSAGSLWCWGNNDHRQVADLPADVLPPTPTQVTSGFAPVKGLGLEEGRTCAVNLLSHVYCVGQDASGDSGAYRAVDVAGNPDTTMPGHSSHVIDDFGRVFDLKDLQKPTRLDQVGTDNAWFGGTELQLCVLKRWGSLWCTGYDMGAAQSRLLPKQALGESAVEAGVGLQFVCALTDQGQVWCDGENALGQSGSVEGTQVGPHAIPNLDGVRKISVNGNSACALKQDGSVWCWGAYAGGVSAHVPTQVSACIDQARVPPPAEHFNSAPLRASEHLAEARQLLGFNACSCQPPYPADPACVAERGAAPNPACLATLAPDLSSDKTWNCQTEAALTQLECLRQATCNEEQRAACVQKTCNVPTELEHVEQYCRRHTCATAPDVTFELNQLCDGTLDCLDGSDEVNCGSGGFFRCNDMSGLTLGHLCDGTPDCPDASDEVFCE